MAFYYLLYLVHTLIIYNFFIFSVFKFSFPSQNLKFQINRSHMEIGLPKEIKFGTTKMIKKTLSMSPCKISNLFLDVVTNVSS